MRFQGNNNRRDLQPTKLTAPVAQGPGTPYDPTHGFVSFGRAFDPTIPNDATIPVGSGKDAGENYRNYVDLANTWDHQAVIPINLGKHDTGWRNSVDLVDTEWPYRVIALTVYSDPLHPRYNDVIVNPSFDSGAPGNFTPDSSQSEIVLVDVAGGLPPGVVDGPYGDAYGLIGPNFHA